MAINKRNFMVATAFLMTASGCSMFSMDLLEDNVVAVVTVPSDELEYRSVAVTQKGTVATVAGELSLDIGRGHGAVPGHMDIIIKTPEGDVLLIGSAPYRRAHSYEQYRHARFEISIYAFLPDHSEVTLKHHSEPMSVHMPLI